MSSLPMIKSEQDQKKLPLTTFHYDNDDSSVNAVNGIAYLENEGDDDSTQAKSDEATQAKCHPTKKHIATASDLADATKRVAQSAVKLEDDADDMKDTSVDMNSNTAAVKHIDAKGKETYDIGREPYQVSAAAAASMGRINGHEPRKEEEPTDGDEDGDKDLKQRDSVATTLATEIPIYSLLTSEEDSGDEDSDTDFDNTRRPQSAWNLFNMAMKGKGLTCKQMTAQYRNLSNREKAKLNAKAEKNKKECEDYQKRRKEASTSKSIASTATKPTAEKASPLPHCNLPGCTRSKFARGKCYRHATEAKSNAAASAEEFEDVAWKCHQCGVLNSICSLRCSAYKCMAYKGRIRHNTPTSTEGCELVWLENGAKIGEVHDNSDECYICFTGGALICCDHCDKSFHLGCHIPPLQEVPFGDFKCCECQATTLRKLFHCGECHKCLRGDSDECPNKRYAPPAMVSPCAKQRSNPSIASSPHTGRQEDQQTSSVTSTDIQNTDTSSKSAQPKDDVPNDLILCQRELKRSREEVQTQAEEIKRLKGAIQALISSSR